MPNKDGTGPDWKGSKTGRWMWNCRKWEPTFVEKESCCQWWSDETESCCSEEDEQERNYWHWCCKNM
jgi:hypothetical protein